MLADRARVWIVEDGAPFARRLREAVEPFAETTWVRTAAEARTLLLSSEPVDALLLDVRLGDESGLDVLEQARPHRPLLPVLVITALEDVATVNRAAALRCFLARKTASPTVLEVAVRFVRYETRDSRLIRGATQRYIDEAKLAPRPAELLRAYMRGVTRADLPNALGMSENTLKTHVKQILAGRFLDLAAVRQHILRTIDDDLSASSGGGSRDPTPES